MSFLRNINPACSITTMSKTLKVLLDQLGMLCTSPSSWKLTVPTEFGTEETSLGLPYPVPLNIYSQRVCLEGITQGYSSAPGDLQHKPWKAQQWKKVV